MAFDESKTQRDIADLKRQVRELQASIPATVRPISSGIAQSVSDQVAENSYTRDQTDQLIANPPNGVNATGNVHGTGDGSFEGVLSASGNITAGRNVVASSGTLVSSYARNNTASRSPVAAVIDMDGSILAQASAERFKRDIHDYPGGDWRAIRPVLYRLRRAYEAVGDEALYEVGVIAEELEQAGFPELVGYDEQGDVFTVHYDRLAVVAINGLQEQDAAVSELADRVGRIERALTALSRGA